MIHYEVSVPSFTEETRVQFSATLNGILYEFNLDFWDDLWHLNIIREGVNRTCTLYFMSLYFPSDPLYQLQWLGTALSGSTFLVAVAE